MQIWLTGKGPRTGRGRGWGGGGRGPKGFDIYMNFKQNQKYKFSKFPGLPRQLASLIEFQKFCPTNPGKVEGHSK